MEHPDGILHKDVLLAVVKAFHSAAVCIVFDCAVAFSTYLVAICIGIGGFFAGLHKFAICSKLKVGSSEEPQFLLFANHVLCAPPIIWLGEFGRNTETSVY